MKNYFQKILALFTGNDYPGSTRQEFYKWLVDEEHVSEKDEALQTLWEEGYKSGTAPNLHQSYELLRRNAVKFDKSAKSYRNNLIANLHSGKETSRQRRPVNIAGIPISSSIKVLLIRLKEVLNSAV